MAVGFRLTDSHDESRGAVAAMREVIEDAGLNPEAVGYINAHGTSTPSNDSTETLAIERIFGDSARQISVSSTNARSRPAPAHEAGLMRRRNRHDA